jgi:hypothetical protein
MEVRGQNTTRPADREDQRPAEWASRVNRRYGETGHGPLLSRRPHPEGDLGRLNLLDVGERGKVQRGVRLLTWFDAAAYTLTAPDTPAVLFRP